MSCSSRKWQGACGALNCVWNDKGSPLFSSTKWSLSFPWWTSHHLPLESACYHQQPWFRQIRFSMLNTLRDCDWGQFNAQSTISLTDSRIMIEVMPQQFWNAFVQMMVNVRDGVVTWFRKGAVDDLSHLVVHQRSIDKNIFWVPWDINYFLCSRRMGFHRRKHLIWGSWSRKSCSQQTNHNR